MCSYVSPFLPKDLSLSRVSRVIKIVLSIHIVKHSTYLHTLTQIRWYFMPKNKKFIKSNTFYPRRLNLTKTSTQVFNLDEIYLHILKCISYNGPSKESQIIKYINKEHSKSDFISREIIRKKIIGSSQTLGLLKHEFLFKHDHKFHLSVKGMIASLSQKSNIKKNKLYLKYIEFVSKFITDQKIMGVLEEIIMSDIQYFLAWHFTTGISLKKTLTYHNYQNDFLHLHTINEDFLKYGEDISDKSLKMEFENSQNQFLQKHYLVGQLVNNGKLPQSIVISENIFSDTKLNKKKIAKVKEEVTITYLILSWSKIMNELVRVNYDDSKIPLKIDKFKDNYQKNRLQQIKKNSIREAKNLGLNLEDQGILGVEIMREDIAEKYGFNSKSR